MDDRAPAVVLRVPQPVASADDWPPQAPCARLIAPAHWQAIDCISDLHLDPRHPRTLAALSHYLAHTPADAVLVLGDLFEAWVGDDMRQQPFEARCVDALSMIAQRAWVGILVGNRDFLMGEGLMNACGAQALPDPFVLEAFGARRLLTHGDAWCLDDAPYLAFRQQVRQPAWQQAFLGQPLDARLATARQMREASEARKAEHQGDATQWADVTPSRAVAWLQHAGCTELVHGHTHKPGRSALDAHHAREVLSDWDLDDTRAPRAEVLRLTARGVQRLGLMDACASEGATTASR
ncbi:UDP-2,3-diacylglucosamine diphosphatase [Aquabacterium fontiphilum]|uniref:UDP-2,3-diacylglucosamine diphosphatase n=1 Tax=Aquabacterium fontiphilum TaxID=450365 RepID=UPI001376EEEC|nr:UDP-2,3-diacylglucosamine diphosphatase [Aquabacterium fontiphilum]NBD19882.1 UDP-2,3-diacylglucosamine diphosphatase [Aquabacterium fontiphilum]